MKIKAEFVMSVAQIEQLPVANIPEIALTGRSNVGKSSLINTLLGKKGLARTSSTPGRTQTLNYYKITIDDKKSFYFVDMPGYGFAAINKSARDQWKMLVEQYLHTRPTLSGILQIIDLRHPPQPLDITMADWLFGNKLDYTIIGTKADKVAKTKVSGLVKQAAEILHVDPKDAFGFSAETGLGKEQIWHWVMDRIRES